MGCVKSSQRVNVTTMSNSVQQDSIGRETLLAALARLDQDIANSEKLHPAQRLTVVAAEIESIQQEIQQLAEITNIKTNTDSYSKIMHQMFENLDLYRRPILAAENEDFVANVNRKEMRRLELSWLRARQKELQQERTLLHAQLLRIRSLYTELQHLLDTARLCSILGSKYSLIHRKQYGDRIEGVDYIKLRAIWSDTERPDTSLENDLNRAQYLRDALANVCVKLKAAAEYSHSALRLLDEALPAWKLASIGKSGWERTQACGDACKLMVHARGQERGARRVLATPSAPRAARALRLALDYAFTDTVNDHKYHRATEIFLQFKEAVARLIKSIHLVLINSIENLAVAEKELEERRQKLRAARANDMLKKGLADLRYQPSTITSLKTSGNIA